MMNKGIRSESSRRGKKSSAKQARQPDGFLILRGKWRLQIVAALYGGPVRLSLLQRCLAGVSKKVLHDNLRALEVAGVVERRDLTRSIPHIEYRLTSPAGMKLADIVVSLQNWKPQRLRSQH